MSNTENAIPRGHFIAGSGSVVERPQLNYSEHFDAEADKAAFEAKWKDSATKKEIREEIRRDDERRNRQRENVKQFRANEKYIDTDEVRRLREKGLLDPVIAERVGVNQRTLARKCGNRTDFVPSGSAQAA